MDNTQTDTNIPEEIVIPDTSKYPGRVPRAVMEQKREALEAQKRQPLSKKQQHEEMVRLQHQIRLNKFLEEFITNGGNATKAAMATGEFKDRYSAAQKGSELLKEARPLVRTYLEEKGFSFGNLLDLMIDKAKEEKNPAYLDRILKMAGIEDFFAKEKPTTTTNVNVITLQKSLADQYMSGDEDIIEGEISEDN